MQTNQSEILDFEKLFSTSLQKKRGIGKEGLDICSVDTRNLKQIPLVILLFSAHWCPPCRGLLPLLKEFYRQVNLVDLEQMVKPQRALHEIFKQELPEYDAVARRIIDEYHCEAKPRMPLNCEIVLISLDTNPFQYQEHVVEMGNWMTVGYGQSHLQRMFDVALVPQLILLEGPTGRIISKNCRIDITKKPAEKLLLEWVAQSSLRCFSTQAN